MAGDMNARLAELRRCLDLSDEDVALAVGSRAATVALLGRMAEVSAPDTGAAKVLLVLARMATASCDWLDGDLRVALTAQRSETTVDVTTDLGGGLLERALPGFALRAPIVEFVRAIERVPRLIAPLSVRTKSPGKVILTASAAVRRTSVPPPVLEIADDSLFAPSTREETSAASEPHAPAPLPVVSVGSPPSLVPEKVDEGWDD